LHSGKSSSSVTKMIDQSGYHHAGHCVYMAQYHIVWCPKFRYGVLKNEKASRLKEILKDVCDAYRYEIRAVEVMPDHIHLFVDVPQTVAPCDIARTLKSRSAVAMLHEFPDLRKFYARCGVLWSRGYFISTAGHISAETVKRYIEEQNAREKAHKN